MCGIAGKIYFGSKKIQEPDLKLMAHAIAHRGPDDEGLFISRNKHVGLVNRRLAIIDLSKRGHQPMSYKNRYWITTNGEIYNFKTEREKLKREGYPFKSNCDTEVILALYDKYQEKCVDYLRGMFAFCIYDSKENVLFLARDRLGVKPLKYYYNRDVFIFSSEVKAILSQKETPKRMDFESINKYLAYGHISAPDTGFENIKKLEPGNFIKIDINKSRIEKTTYWRPSFKEKWDLSEKEWEEKILDTLIEATKLRMISDVPVGAFLSGGVDSSAVVATMAQVSKRPVNTFTITFKDESWNEQKHAKRIARLYKTNHFELAAKPLNTDSLDEISYFYEEPFTDAGAIVSYMVNKLARKHVTVILNGDGGDENFAGYPNRHLRIKRDIDYALPLKLGTSIFPIVKSIANNSNSKFFKKASNFLQKAKTPIYERYLSYNQIFSSDEIADLTKRDLRKSYNKNLILDVIKQTFKNFKGQDLRDFALEYELKYWLADDLLAKADLMSMANGVEGRSPFLDYKMVELAAKIPFDLKVKNNEPKYILKKALEKIVPKENLYRQKRGFGIPLHIWYSGKLNDYTKSKLLNKKSKTKEFINPKIIKEMLKRHDKNHDFGPKLWTLLTLELWMENYFS